MRLRFLSCVGVAVLALGPRLAWADGRDPTGAEALFLAGREAVERKDYATACPKFAESDRLDPAAGTQINLADCEEHIDRPAAAWGHWKAAIDLLDPSDPRLPACKERAAAVEKRVPRLVLKLRPGSPAGTRVMRDGTEIGPAALGIAIPQEPGEHALLVTAPGHKTRETSLTLVEGEVKEVVLETGELEVAPLPVVTTPPVLPEAPPSSTSKTLGVVLVGAGLAGLAVGTTTGIMALSKKSDVQDNCFPVGVCNARGHDAATSGRTLAIVSTIGFSAGAALLGVGAVLFLTAPKTPTAASTRGARTTASPLFLPGGIGLAFTREL